MKMGLTVLSCFAALLLTLTPVVFSADNIDAKKDVMPLGHGSALPKVVLKDTKGLDLIVKGNKKYYADGRLAEENLRGELRVYTYHDDLNGYSLFKKNTSSGDYSISEYRKGKLVSTTLANGQVYKYNPDGSLFQRISIRGRGAAAHVLVEEFTYFKDTDGASVTIKTENGKYESTTRVFTKDGHSFKTIDQYTGSQWIYKDGLLISFKERTDMGWKTSGMVTTYEYTYDKQGRLETRIGTRSDGYVTILNYKNNTRRAGPVSPVNFQKVLTAAIESVAKPSTPVTVKTNDGNLFTLQNGLLEKIKRVNATYFYRNGMLDSIELEGGKRISFR